MVPHLPCEHSQTLHREGGLFIFTVNSFLYKDIAVLGGVYLRKLARARVSHQDDFFISYKNRGDSRRHDILWWYHVNKYRAMRVNRSELAPGWKLPQCHVNTPLDQFCAYTVSHYGSLYVSGKLLTYPSPKPAETLISHLGQNVGFLRGGGGRWSVSQKHIMFCHDLVPSPIHKNLFMLR